MKSRRVLRGVGANVFDRGAIAAMQLVLVPIQLSHWGVHVYGLWVLIFTVPSFLAFSDFGFASAAGTTMTMQVARGERDAAITTMHSARVAILIASLLLVVVSLAIIWSLPASLIAGAAGFGEREMRLAISLLVAHALLSLQTTVVLAGFRADGMYSTAATVHALIILWESACMIVAIVLGGSPAVAAAAYLAGRVTGAAAQALLLRRRVPWLSAGYASASRPVMRQLLAPAAGVMALSIAQASFLQGSAIAIGAAMSAAAVPAFTTLRTLSRLGLQGTGLLNNALMPEFSAATARGDRRAQARMLALTLIVSAVVIVPFAAILALFGARIVALWTHGLIVPPAGLVWAMAAAILVSGFWTPASNLIVAMNLQGKFTYRYLLFALASVALTYLLALTLGQTGAGLALLALECVMAAVVARLVVRHITAVGVIRTAVQDVWNEGRAFIRRRR